MSASKPSGGIAARALGLAARLRTTPADWMVRGLLLVAACAAARHGLLYRTNAVDDAYITFRHSHNLVHGDGPVYNPGEHVEGTSSFLWMLLVAGGLAAGFDAMATARAMGLVSFVFLTLIAFATVKSIVPHGGRILGLLAATTVAASTPLAVFSESGLETTLDAALVAASLFLFVRPENDPRRPYWALVMGLAATTRPESLMFFFCFVGLDLARAGGRPLWTRRPLAALGWFAMVYGPVLAFRLLYYHAWIPNSLTAKSGMPLRFAHAHTVVAFCKAVLRGDGARDIREHLEHLGIGAALLAGGIAHRRTIFASVACLAVGACCAVVDIRADGDWMGHCRFLTPAMAPLDVALGLSLGAILYRFAPRTLLGRIGAAIPVFLVTVSVADSSDYQRHVEDPADARSYSRWVAEQLRTVRLDGDWLATDMAGEVPYVSGLRTLDMFGLCDRYIALHGERFGAMGKLDWDYVIAHRPTFYWFNFTSWIADLYQEPSFADQRDEYWAVITPQYRSYEGNDRKLLLVRRDRPDLERLVKTLGATLVDPRTELHRLGQW